MTAPKLFISYSWSNPEHEQWVLDLATQLRESEVDVILDKWDLREGQDTIVFMEQMVTDKKINKVVIISDATYAAKADGRNGGVGTETQIISKEVYDKQDQRKFVVVVAEKNDLGKPCLPTYYKSRLYIDLSEADRYSENFDKLLRLIFDKPLYVKPELGKKPSFLEEGEHISLGTTATFKRCVEALKNNKPNAAGVYDEYCNTLVLNLERFRLSQTQEAFDEAVVRSIEEFIPFRNEAIQLFITIAQYSPTPEFVKRTHRLFEKLIPYMHRPEHVDTWQRWDFDNFRFLIHELFLYALAIFIKHDRLEQAQYLLAQQYYFDGNYNGNRDVMASYIVFREYMESLEARNNRLKLQRQSLRSDLLKDRCNGTGIEFRDLMQADFVAFLRAEIEAKGNYCRWYPETLLYLGHFNSAFEIFARSKSKGYFNSVKGLLGIDSVEDLKLLLISYHDGSRKRPSWDFQSINPAALVGFEQLETRA
jgi:TIR domain